MNVYRFNSAQCCSAEVLDTYNNVVMSCTPTQISVKQHFGASPADGMDESSSKCPTSTPTTSSSCSDASVVPAAKASLSHQPTVEHHQSTKRQSITKANRKQGNANDRNKVQTLNQGRNQRLNQRLLRRRLANALGMPTALQATLLEQAILYLKSGGSSC